MSRVKIGDKLKNNKYLLTEFPHVDLIHNSGINFHTLLSEIDSTAYYMVG